MKNNSCVSLFGWQVLVDQVFPYPLQPLFYTLSGEITQIRGSQKRQLNFATRRLYCTKDKAYEVWALATKFQIPPQSTVVLTITVLKMFL